jgi:xylulokinase
MLFMNGPVLTIDVGTTLIKGALFTPAGEVLVKKRRPLPQAPLFAGDRHEIDPRDWTQGIRDLWAEMAPEAREAPAALCLSGNGPTLVCTDREGTPLGPALSWLDRRSIEETRQIQEKTGSYIDPTFYLPKLLWMRKHQPHLFGRIHHVFGCPEFLLHKATGRAVQLLTGPALAKYVWNNSLIEALELPEKIFPPRRGRDFSWGPCCGPPPGTGTFPKESPSSAAAPISP